MFKNSLFSVANLKHWLVEHETFNIKLMVF